RRRRVAHGQHVRPGLKRRRRVVHPPEPLATHDPCEMLPRHQTDRGGAFPLRLVELRVEKPDFAEASRYHFTSPRRRFRTGWSRLSITKFLKASLSSSRKFRPGHSGSTAELQVTTSCCRVSSFQVMRVHLSFASRTASRGARIHLSGS